MPILRLGPTLLYFAHIPKTGGTSVERYLASKGPLSFQSPHKPEGMVITPQHAHARLVRTLFDEGFFSHSFAVLRDPVDRLISEYRWRTGQSKRARKGGVVARRFGRKRILGFDEWVPLVLRKYRDNPLINDNHIRPQAEFVDGIETLFAFEDGFAPIYDWIDAATGTAPGPRDAHEKQSAGDRPVPSAETLRLIGDFYAEDAELHAKVRRGRS